MGAPRSSSTEPGVPYGFDMPVEDYPATPQFTTPVIDQLEPESELHENVLDYLMKRLKASEDEMRDFYARWQVNEYKFQAYINLPDWEKTLKEMNDKGEVPKITSLTIPYSFAAISTIVTFMLHAFTGRKPLFTLGAWKDEAVQNAKMMEVKLEYDATSTRLVKFFRKFLLDSQLYGLAAFRVNWETKIAMRTRRRVEPKFDEFGRPDGTSSVPVREPATVYEGNVVESIDPFMFFPDPNVPMTEVNRKGEFVFWRTFVGRHDVKALENSGVFKWVDSAPKQMPASVDEQASGRGVLSGGRPVAGMGSDKFRKGAGYYQADQGTIILIPRELGIGLEEAPQMWQFTVLNKGQIVQAERVDNDHELHPVAVAEPQSMGYGFGEAGSADWMSNIQDAMSWLFNSHMDNVRRVINDMLIYDPSRIEEQDIKKPGPGKRIRLKPTAFGQDVRTLVQQLPIQDVTRGNIEDMEVMFRFSQLILGANENMMGAQSAGGRKTATEVRRSDESAASRLAGQTRTISAQAITDLTEMMCLNNQQYLSDEFYMTVVGQEGADKPLYITADSLVGDFHYPVHDGTLPTDKVALLDVWKEIFTVILADPLMRQQFDVAKLFEFIAELGGAQNIEQFKINVVPDQTALAGLAGGDLAPVGNLSGGPSGLINAIPGSPGNRLAGAF